MLRVASFNVRYGSADDGPDRWAVRRERVVAVIAGLDCDVVGLQEVESFQVRELLAALPRYAAIGVHRDDGRVRGEACTILYDRSRFVVAESGVFWLSETPDVVASKGWDAALPRVCTWARVVEIASGRGCWIWNTHFDHRGRRAREQAARLVLARVRESGARAGRRDPVVVAGDLNASEQEAPLAVLLHPPDDAGVALVDAYRQVRPDGAAGTFNGFDPEDDGGDRKIDHVLVGGLRVRDAGIETRRFDGRHASDHFAVWAELAWSDQSR